jgi:hypothetical protein
MACLDPVRGRVWLHIKHITLNKPHSICAINFFLQETNHCSISHTVLFFHPRLKGTIRFLAQQHGHLNPSVGRRFVDLVVDEGIVEPASNVFVAPEA